MIHLDASFLIRALIPGSAEDHRFRKWLREGESTQVSAVAWAEFLCGPVEQTASKKLLQVLKEPIALDHVAAASAAHLFDQTGRRRGSLCDCMIAAVALLAGAAVASSEADFSRFEAAGLQIAEH